MQARWAEQPVDRFPGGCNSGEGDDHEDEQAGEVLSSPEPAGLAPGRDTAAEDERDPEWDGGEAAERLTRKIANCRTVVPGRRNTLIFSARTPWVLASRASFMDSVASWVCGTRGQWRTVGSNASTPDVPGGTGIQ